MNKNHCRSHVVHKTRPVNFALNFQLHRCALPEPLQRATVGITDTADVQSDSGFFTQQMKSTYEHAEWAGPRITPGDELSLSQAKQKVAFRARAACK